MSGKARVKIYGPTYSDSGRCEETLIAEFVTTGMDNFRDGYTCYLFSFMVDYSGMGDQYPRSKYAYPLIAHKWNGKTRQGEYFSFPYKGRLEIEAI